MKLEKQRGEKEYNVETKYQRFKQPKEEIRPRKRTKRNVEKRKAYLSHPTDALILVGEVLKLRAKEKTHCQHGNSEKEER